MFGKANHHINIYIILYYMQFQWRNFYLINKIILYIYEKNKKHHIIYGRTEQNEQKTEQKINSFFHHHEQ